MEAEGSVKQEQLRRLGRMYTDNLAKCLQGEGPLYSEESMHAIAGEILKSEGFTDDVEDCIVCSLWIYKWIPSRACQYCEMTFCNIVGRGEDESATCLQVHEAMCFKRKRSKPSC